MQKLGRFARCCFTGSLLVATCLAQDSLPAAPQPNQTAAPVQHESTLAQIRDLPAQWLIGPYIRSRAQLIPLTGKQRFDVYIHQSYLTAAPYVLHVVEAGIDQARNYPSQWGGGMQAYGERFGNRHGQYLIANTLTAAGDAVVKYEPRYDLCQCRSFLGRTGHAIIRNFITYNDTEHEWRPQVPLYVGNLAAGLVSKEWLPGKRDAWVEGGHAVLGQAGWGCATNWVNEFAVDILRKITSNRYPKTLP